jgi:FkbM family methyltransferase
MSPTEGPFTERRAYGTIGGDQGSATGARPFVSVVIPARNASSTIGEQLRALSRQTYSGEFEVIVTGNQCTDDTQEVVESFAVALPDLHYVAADDRAGASHARNVGVASTRGDALLFCDADDVVDPGWVGGMVTALHDADVVAGVLEPRGRSPGWAVRNSFVPVRAMPVTLQGVAYAVGASMAYRREVHGAIGGWDDRFVVGGDDVAVSLKAQRAGFRMGFADDAVCRYTLRRTVRQAARQQRTYGRGEALLVTLYAPELDRGLAMDLGTLCRDVLRLAVSARSVDDLRTWILQMSFQGSRMVSLARLRRHAGREAARHHVRAQIASAVPPVLRTRRLSRIIAAREWHQPIVEFTFPPGTPTLEGLGAQAPASVASCYSRLGPLLEPKTLSVANRLLSDGGKLLDIGANIGLFSMAALRRVGPSGSVVAVEPNPGLMQVLSSNLERHRDPDAAWSIIRGAAGAERGALDLWISPNSLVGGVAPSPYYQGDGERVTVEVLPLDELHLTGLDLIKIDVEGYEPEVLTGLADTIRRNPAVCLVLELNPACLERGGHRIDDLLSHEVLDGHRMWVIDDSASPPAPAIEPLVDVRARIDTVGVDEQWFRNVIAVPVERAEWFEREVAPL